MREKFWDHNINICIPRPGQQHDVPTFPPAFPPLMMTMTSRTAASTSVGRRRRRTSAVLGAILASSVALSAEASETSGASSMVHEVSDTNLLSEVPKRKRKLRTLAASETEIEPISLVDTPGISLDLGLNNTDVELVDTNEEAFFALAEDHWTDHRDLNIRACLETDADGDGSTGCPKNRAQAEWMKWPLESVQGLPIISNLCVENNNDWPSALNKARKQWNKKSLGSVQLKYQQAKCDTRQNALLTHIPNAIHVVYGTCGADCCGKADVEYKYRFNAKGEKVITQYSALVRVDRTCHDTNSPMYNLQYILCHEVGHALGLAHDYGAGSCMGEWSDGKRPGKGDVKTLLQMYGENISKKPAKL